MSKDNLSALDRKTSGTLKKVKHVFARLVIPVKSALDHCFYKCKKCTNYNETEATVNTTRNDFEIPKDEKVNTAEQQDEASFAKSKYEIDEDSCFSATTLVTFFDNIRTIFTQGRSRTEGYSKF